jgi:hypothetical protein
MLRYMYIARLVSFTKVSSVDCTNQPFQTKPEVFWDWQSFRFSVKIWFNKICKTKQLTPKYYSIKLNGNNRQSRNIRIAATRYRINHEIKFLYCEKLKLNEPLYRIHLECAKYWNVSWQYIQTATNAQIDKMMDSICHNLNKELDALQKYEPQIYNNKNTTKHTSIHD